MVDHPDFCSEREMEKAKATMPLQILRDREEEEDDDDEESANDEKNGTGAPPSSSEKVDEFQLEVDAAIAAFNPAMQRRSLSSIRSGVTVAMVAVALGFACCKETFVLDGSPVLFDCRFNRTDFVFISYTPCSGENLLHIFIFNRSSLRSGKSNQLTGVRFLL